MSLAYGAVSKLCSGAALLLVAFAVTASLEPAVACGLTSCSKTSLCNDCTDHNNDNKKCDQYNELLSKVVDGAYQAAASWGLIPSMNWVP